MRALLFLNVKMRYLDNGIISHFVTYYNFNIPIVKIRFMNITLIENMRVMKLKND